MDDGEGFCGWLGGTNCYTRHCPWKVYTESVQLLAACNSAVTEHCPCVLLCFVAGQSMGASCGCILQRVVPVCWCFKPVAPARPAPQQQTAIIIRSILRLMFRA